MLNICAINFLNQCHIERDKNYTYMEPLKKIDYYVGAIQTKPSCAQWKHNKV